MKKNIYDKILQTYKRKQRLNQMQISDAKRSLAQVDPSYSTLIEKIATKGRELALCSINNLPNASATKAQLQNEIQELEKQANIIFNKHAREINLRLMFDCPACRDTGFIGESYCECFRKKVSDELSQYCGILPIEMEKIGGLDSYSLDLFDDSVNEEKYGAKASPRATIGKALEACKEFLADKSLKNLIFSGASGTGKTYMVKALAYDLLQQMTEVIFISAPDMFDQLISERFDRDGNGLMERLCEAEVLIIDDLGVETKSEAKTALLLQLLAARQENKRTIITTNIKLEFLGDKYDQRVRSRITGAFKAYRFIGDDLRIRLRGKA